ncbi:probable RNA-directed DNA polymerase from transposon BS [Trichonephila clavipes]|nr:probable RNA-directed DNA polymerase from transposon BS [Trichonephila clavipes]
MAGRLDIMKHLGYKLGHFSVTYAFQSDNARIKEAEMKSRSSTLDARRALRMRKKVMHEHFVEMEGVTYEAENKRPDNFTNNIDSDVTSTLENFFANPPTTPLAPTNTDEFIINANFLNPNQYGFTKQLSTYHPLLRLTEQISVGFQRGRSTGAVFLDIQKAFDRVWISGLIYKLITHNFPAPLIHIVNSYLVNRTYKVRVNNTFSLPHRVNIGVTQGSLLGPVLFNIYLNDIPSHPQTMLNLYADDTTILATFKNHKTVTLALNKHLALLENYFNQWKIKINVEKTVAVLFTKRIKPVKPPTLYSTPLQWSQSTKYLGLILDKNLTWKHHILHARDKFRHTLRLIYPLICRNSEMDMYNKMLLYTAVLRPIISYGCPVWGYAAKTNINILDVAQNSIIRSITKANRYTRNSNIYKALKLHPFKKYIQNLAKKFFANLPNINNSNLMNLENYTPLDNHKRPRRILSPRLL